MRVIGDFSNFFNLTPKMMSNRYLCQICQDNVQKLGNPESETSLMPLIISAVKNQLSISMQVSMHSHLFNVHIVFHTSKWKSEYKRKYKENHSLKFVCVAYHRSGLGCRSKDPTSDCTIELAGRINSALHLDWAGFRENFGKKKNRHF